MSVLDKSLGAYLISVVISACLFGITCMQTLYYFQKYNDRLALKLIVVVLWFLEAVHSAFLTHAIYFYVIINYGNPSGITTATWSGNMIILVSGITAIIVRIFYAWRIWLVSQGVGHRNRVLPAIITFLSLGSFGLALAETGILSSASHVTTANTGQVTNLRISTYVALPVAMVIDTSIAASLSYYLLKSRSGLQGTKRIISRIMVISINNGAILSVIDTFILCFTILQQGNLLFATFASVIANIYSNTLLATLNSRRRKPEVIEIPNSLVFRATEQSYPSAGRVTGLGQVSLQLSRAEHVIDVEQPVNAGDGSNMGGDGAKRDSKQITL